MCASKIGSSAPRASVVAPSIRTIAMVWREEDILSYPRFPRATAGTYAGVQAELQPIEKCPDTFRLSCGGRQPGEPPLHRIDLREVVADVVIAAPLVGIQPETAPCIGVAGPGSAEVDHCGQILLLLERGGGNPLAPSHARAT